MPASATRSRRPQAARKGVYDRLREDILCCALQPGSRVHEQALAERFHVSKSPIREALLRLQEQRLVEVLPRKGYRVLPISVSDAAELYQMRLLFEPACVAGAIAGASDAQLAQLDMFRRVPARRSLPAWIAYNRGFHNAIARLCGNARLARAAIEVIEQFDRLTYVGLHEADSGGGLQDFVDEHGRIIDAMKRRDKRLAQALVRRHVESSRRRAHAAIASPVIVP